MISARSRRTAAKVSCTSKPPQPLCHHTAGAGQEFGTAGDGWGHIGALKRQGANTRRAQEVPGAATAAAAQAAQYCLGHHWVLQQGQHWGTYCGRQRGQVRLRVGANQSKSMLHRVRALDGVTHCSKGLAAGDSTPARRNFHFPGRPARPAQARRTQRISQLSVRPPCDWP